MSAQQQWEDAYAIAEMMHEKNGPAKRIDLNVLEQIICARYNTIFEYDPYQDEYTFRKQKLAFENPVKPLCRPIAEADLEELKNNTIKTQLPSPSYFKMCPIYLVAPCTLLIFSYSHRPSSGLNEALQKASPTLKNPSEAEVTAGSIFIYRHKDGQCYRCIILSEDTDESLDSDRKYQVAFLDIVQVVWVKIRTLFIPGEFTLDKYPCALLCARLVGISSIRKDYVPEINSYLRQLYNDRPRRKAGVMALFYKLDNTENKMIIDYPSILDVKEASSEEIKMVHGHQSCAVKDPLPLTYAQLINKEVLPLEYADEKGATCSDKSDIELLSEKRSTKESALAATNPTDKHDCPFGRNSIEKFFENHKALLPPPSRTKFSEPLRRSFSPSFSNKTKKTGQLIKNKSDDEFSNDTDDSLSSFHSCYLNQQRSSIPTPQPSSDEPRKEEITLKKINENFERTEGRSQNGWKEEKDYTPSMEVALFRRTSSGLSDKDTFGQRTLMNESFPTPSPECVKKKTDSEVISLQSARQRVSSPDPRESTPSPHVNSGLATTSTRFPLTNVIQENQVANPSVRADIHSHILGRQISPGEEAILISPIPFAEQNYGTSAASYDQHKNTLCQAGDNFPTSQGISVSQTTTNNRMKYLFEEKLPNAGGDNAWDLSAERIQTTKEKEPKQVSDLIARSSTSEDDNYSVTSLCSEDYGGIGHNLSEVENGADASTIVIVDEFVDVPDSLKQLATNFCNDARNAVVQKNHSSFMAEIFAMTVVSGKLSNDLDKRFWKSKLAEAKGLDAAFD